MPFEQYPGERRDVEAELEALRAFFASIDASDTPLARDVAAALDARCLVRMRTAMLGWREIAAQVAGVARGKPVLRVLDGGGDGEPQPD